MNSLKLAARCHQHGLLSKEAFADVLRVREQLIKEAISRQAATRFFGRGREGAADFMAKLKKGLGFGGMAKATAKGKIEPLSWPEVTGNLVRLLAGGAVIGGGLTAGSAAVSSLTKHRKDKSLQADIEKAYPKMLQEYPKLQEMDRGKVSRHFGVLARYAPSLAADPMVAGSWVQSTTQMGYIDTDAIKRLSDTQSAIDKASEGRPLDTSHFGKGVALAQTAMGG